MFEVLNIEGRAAIPDVKVYMEVIYKILQGSDRKGAGGERQPEVWRWLQQCERYEYER